MSDKKEIIRQSAIVIFAKQGYFNTTTDQIADHAGIAVGTIYNYFKNKQDILEYIFTQEYEKRSKLFQEIMTKDQHTADKLMAIVKKHFDEVVDNPSLIKIMLYERQNAKNYSYKDSRLKEIFTHILEEGLRKGEIKKEIEPQIVSSFVFGSIEGIMRDYLEKYSLKNAEPKEFFDHAVHELENFIKSGLLIK